MTNVHTTRCFSNSVLYRVKGYSHTLLLPHLHKFASQTKIHSHSVVTWVIFKTTNKATQFRSSQIYSSLHVSMCHFSKLDGKIIILQD